MSTADNSLNDWMQSISEQGQRDRKEREEIRKERAEFLRTYFSGPGRTADLGENVTWWQGSTIVLNSKYSEAILQDDFLLEMIWEEASRRASFDEAFKLRMGMPL